MAAANALVMGVDSARSKLWANEGRDRAVRDASCGNTPAVWLFVHRLERRTPGPVTDPGPASRPHSQLSIGKLAHKASARRPDLGPPTTARGRSSRAQAKGRDLPPGAKPLPKPGAKAGVRSAVARASGSSHLRGRAPAASDRLYCRSDARNDDWPCPKDCPGPQDQEQVRAKRLRQIPGRARDEAADLETLQVGGVC
ncbi:hypothetical protein GCM10022295_62650 [Streptomyces osmaniensis]|uniref:Transposase n=1 Tax=Streptomyces osmaniensis TaxID=593134 RepID=A0ABP6XUF1_9ACTN